MDNLDRATFYYLSKSKDTVINMFVILGISIIVVFAIRSDVFKDRGGDYLLLIVYILVLAATLIQANSMIVDLTVKDILSNRVQFFLSSGIGIEELMHSYTIQIFRISSIVPFLFFLISCITRDLHRNTIQLVLLYLSTVLLCFFEIMTFNIISFSVTKYKLYKNILFFGSFLFIYVLCTFASTIVSKLDKLGIDILFLLVALNIVCSIVLIVFSKLKSKKLTNETIVGSSGQWI